MADAQAPAPEPGPGVQTVLEVPVRQDEGGEWELLLAKVRAWWISGEPQALWQGLRRPLGGGVTLVVVLLLLQVYAAFVGALESLPLLPGLLELVGLVWLLSRGLPQLLRSSERERLVDHWSRRWRAFRGAA